MLLCSEYRDNKLKVLYLPKNSNNCKKAMQILIKVQVNQVHKLQIKSVFVVL